jgi:hypothetical protein
VEIADNHVLGRSLYFKGGTCAAMRGFLDRFSVDLDFDLKRGVDRKMLAGEFEKVFLKLGLEIKDQSKKTFDYNLRYKAGLNQRNTIKLEAVDFGAIANIYEPVYLPEIGRTMVCQTLETMFANKLVALLDRFERNGSLAGRDIYDIHRFYISGNNYLPAVIKERTGLDQPQFLQKLMQFIQKNITQTIIDEDLNSLLTKAQFDPIRKILKIETLNLLENDYRRLIVSFPPPIGVEGRLQQRILI